jgi:hypothetical protein
MTFTEFYRREWRFVLINTILGLEIRHLDTPMILALILDLQP